MRLAQNSTKVFIAIACLAAVASCGKDDDGGSDDSSSPNVVAGGGSSNGSDSPTNETGNQNQNNQNNESSDNQIPEFIALNLSFTDTDLSYQEISGNLQFDPATDESSIEEYVVYWGTNSNTKQSPVPVATINKTGGNISLPITADTPIPAGAKFFLIYSSNSFGESSLNASIRLTELAEVSREISTGSHDWQWEESGAGFNNSATTTQVSVPSGLATGFHFENIIIPSGANISTAFLRVVFTQLAGTTVTVAAHDADSGSTCSSALTCDALATNKTTADASWGPLDSNATGIPLASSELEPIISELITRPGWNSGQNMTLMLLQASGAGTTDFGSFENSFPETELVVRYTYEL